MSQSDVDCCNSALQRLGEPSVIALDSSTLQGRQLLIAYDSNRKSELRKHRWNFSIKRAVLAPDTATPLFHFTYQFTLPADCLRVLMPKDVDLDWVVEGRKILSNASSVLNLRYIADVTDATQWDSIFYDMLASSLASDLCQRLTNSTAKKQAIDAEYAELSREARRNNAFEQRPVEPPDDGFLTAHRSGFTQEGGSAWPAGWVNITIQAEP
jgi:hypothetical protein